MILWWTLVGLMGIEVTSKSHIKSNIGQCGALSGQYVCWCRSHHPCFDTIIEKKQTKQYLQDAFIRSSIMLENVWRPPPKPFNSIPYETSSWRGFTYERIVNRTMGGYSLLSGTTSPFGGKQCWISNWNVMYASKQGSRISWLAQTGFAAFGKRGAAHQWNLLRGNRTTFSINLAKWYPCHLMMIRS